MVKLLLCYFPRRFVFSALAPTVSTAVDAGTTTIEGAPALADGERTGERAYKLSAGMENRRRRPKARDEQRNLRYCALWSGGASCVSVSESLMRHTTVKPKRFECVCVYEIFRVTSGVSCTVVGWKKDQ